MSTSTLTEKKASEQAETRPQEQRSAPVPPVNPQPKRRRVGRRRRLIVLPIAAILLGVGLYYGVTMLLFSLSHESTDDAQIDGHIVPINPRVAGYVSSISVDDNQPVKAGAPILTIDPADYDLRVTMAQAALASARAGLENAQAAVEVAKANEVTAEVNRDKAQTDLTRDEKLFKGGAINDRELTDSQSNAKVEDAKYAVAERQLAAAQVAVSASQAQIAQRQADVKLAKLNLSYTKIVAPVNGVISKKNVEPGQYVEPGQSLMAVTELNDTWVEANFKETQVGQMKVGMPVEIEVDSYPDHIFHGKIDSFSAATGAKFALLPPDNATGNFVKVTQRIPVKILITDKPDSNYPLRPGMSVTAIVKTK